jgi:cation transport ATPase
VRSVNATASRLDGVEKAEVSFETKVLKITMKPGKTMTKEALDAAFKDTDFSIKSFKAVEAEKKDDGKKEE